MVDIARKHRRRPRTSNTLARMRRVVLHRVLCLLWTCVLSTSFTSRDDSDTITGLASAAAASSVKLLPTRILEKNQKRITRHHTARLASANSLNTASRLTMLFPSFLQRTSSSKNCKAAKTSSKLLLVSRTKQKPQTSDAAPARTRRRRLSNSSSSLSPSRTYQDRPSSCSNELLAQSSKLKQKQPGPSSTTTESEATKIPSATIENTGPTLISGIAQHFQGIFCKGGRDLNTVQLLKSCRYLEKIMRQVGQRANANELLSNINKVEAVYKAAPKNQRETVSDLLLYERDTLQIHQPHGLLHDPSAAIGLLWLRRSLEFQTKLYQYAILAEAAPNVDATAAALHAYHDTLERYHGWKIQRVYSLALRTSTPNRADMCVSLSGYYHTKGSTRTRTTGSTSHSSTTSRRSSSRTSSTTSSSYEHRRNKDAMTILTRRQEEILQKDMKQLLSQWNPVSWC